MLSGLPSTSSAKELPGRGGSEQLAIFGSERSRRGAELKARMAGGGCRGP